MSRRGLQMGHVRLAVLAASLLTGGDIAFADEKIIIKVGGIEKQIYIPAKLTETLGYFKDEGIEVELQTDAAGVDAEDELIAGTVHGVVGFYDHCVDLQARGKFVVAVVQMAKVPGEVELVSTNHPEIQSPADFRGYSLGVTGLGSSTNFLTQFLAVKNGVKLGEFTSIPIGSGSTFISAMRQDMIQAGMTTEPTVSIMLASGDAKILVDLRSAETTRAALGGLYPGAAFYVETTWANQNRETVQKLVNAFVKTLRFIDTHTATEIADHMPRDYFAGDKDRYIRALEDGKGMFTPDGMMPAGGPETVYSVLAAFSRTVKDRKIDLAKTYTDEFVKVAQ